MFDANDTDMAAEQAADMDVKGADTDKDREIDDDDTDCAAEQADAIGAVDEREELLPRGDVAGPGEAEHEASTAASGSDLQQDNGSDASSQLNLSSRAYGPTYNWINDDSMTLGKGDT